MNTKPSHTPRQRIPYYKPWSTHPHSMHLAQIVDAQDEPVIHSLIDEDLAAHIVRCVNRFDELVTALRLTQRNLDALAYMQPLKTDETDKASSQTWREVVQNAIARAREE